MSETEKTIYRSYEQIETDCCAPFSVYGDFLLIESSQRHSAILEVLQRLPEDIYEKWNLTYDNINFFIPDPQVGGMIIPFYVTDTPTETLGDWTHRPYARVLYLCPTLERAAYDIVLATVVHEMCHAILKHDLFTRNEQYEQQEQEVFEHICMWGFEREAKKHQSLCKRKTTLETKI